MKGLVFHLEDILLEAGPGAGQLALPEGFWEMLEDLYLNGVKIQAATALSAGNALNLLARFHISAWIERIFWISDDCSLSAAFYEEALKTVDLRPEDCLCIAGRDCAIAWAKEAGLCSAAFQNPRLPGESLREAVLVIEGFEEIGSGYLDKVHRRGNHLPWTILATDRLVIREMTVEDLEALYEIYEDPRIARFMEPLYPEREKEEEYTKSYIRYAYEFYGYGLWAVVEKATGRLIGRAGISNREIRGGTEQELGYLIAGPYQGQGLAYEACHAVVEYGWNSLGLARLNCLIHRDNIPSIRLAGKLGFQYMEDIEARGELLRRYCIDNPLPNP